MELKVGEVNIAIAFLARMRRCIASTRASPNFKNRLRWYLTLAVAWENSRECGLLIVWLVVAACFVLHVTS